MLIPIENFLNKQTVKKFRESLEDTSWEDGKNTAGGQAQQLKSNLQLASEDPIGKQLGQHILNILAQHPIFISAALPKKIFPPKFNNYQNNGHYGLHIDNAIMYLPDNEVMRTDLSATLFLSEPEEYSGGELCIETQYGIQEVKLPAGDMILYPSTSLHQVKPVTSGKRISSFFWIESLISDSHQREILFDLDQSIQALRNENTHNEVSRLTGIYHNLVRKWAQT